MKQSRLIVGAASLVVVALVGCTPVAAPPSPKPSSVAVEPAPAPTAPQAELADDVLLVMSTVATADNGAMLDLSLTVHRPLAFDDPAAGPATDLMIDSCGGGTDAALYADNLWTFATVDVNATAREGEAWPADKRIILSPLSTYLMVAASGAVLDDDEVDPATPLCRRDKHIDSAGTGTVIVGFAGDTDDVAAAGQFTKWANHMWGFSGVRVAGQSAQSAGITLSDCVYLVTSAGAELNGDAEWWVERNDTARCQVGSAQETQDF